MLPILFRELIAVVLNFNVLLKAEQNVAHFSLRTFAFVSIVSTSLLKTEKLQCFY